jgi:hypothetical protein
LITPNRRTRDFSRPLVVVIGAAAAGLAAASGINYLNEDSEAKAFAPRDVANQHTTAVSGGITLEQGATVRANPVVNDGNTVCLVGIGQAPVNIKTKEATLADGVETNPNDENGPWVRVDLKKLPDSMQTSCADGIARDGDGKGWVSVNAGKVDVHLK